jgi:hypothetical protein
MSQGYHQYGIEWDPYPVNLAPIRDDTRRIVEEERAKREAMRASNSGQTNAPDRQAAKNAQAKPSVQVKLTNPPPPQVATTPPLEVQSAHKGWILFGLLALLAGGFALSRKRAARQGSCEDPRVP